MIFQGLVTMVQPSLNESPSKKEGKLPVSWDDWRATSPQ